MYPHAQNKEFAAAAGGPLTPGKPRADLLQPLQRLEALRTLDARRVLPELILILAELPRAELDLTDRFRALRKLERAVVRVSAVMTPASKGPRAGAPGRSPGMGTGLSLEQRLYSGMAHGCVHFLHELDRGQGFFSEEHASARAWAIRVAFRFFSRELLYAVKTGRGWPPLAWLALHDLFVYLVMRGSVRLHGESPVLDEDEFDPEVAYKRLLLIGLLTDLLGCERITAEVVARVRAMAAGARLVASDGLVGEFGLILVEVGRDRPPQLKIGSLDDPFRGWVLRVPADFPILLRSLDPFHKYRIGESR